MGSPLLNVRTLYWPVEVVYVVARGISLLDLFGGKEESLSEDPVFLKLQGPVEDCRSDSFYDSNEAGVRSKERDLCLEIHAFREAMLLLERERHVYERLLTSIGKKAFNFSYGLAAFSPGIVRLVSASGKCTGIQPL